MADKANTTSNETSEKMELAKAIAFGTAVAALQGVALYGGFALARWGFEKLTGGEVTSGE